MKRILAYLALLALLVVAGGGGLLAQKADVPVVVCTLRGTQTVLERLLKCKPSKVELHLLEVIPAQELQGVTTVDIADRVYKLMADDLGPENILTPEEEESA